MQQLYYSHAPFSNSMPLDLNVNRAFLKKADIKIFFIHHLAEEYFLHREIEKIRHVFGVFFFDNRNGMAGKENNEAIPQQYKGNKLNVEHSVIAPSIKDAVAIFKESVRRMLDVNTWHEITNSALSSFRLTDEKGRELHREAHENDLFKIEIPGPGSVAGEGYDWVRVEMVKAKINRVAMRVRPARSPLNSVDDTAHFFASDATSTFQVFRRGRIVSAGVYSRNEMPNTQAEKVIDKVRNAAVAIGAIAGASRIQWESLVHGILGEYKKEIQT